LKLKDDVDKRKLLVTQSSLDTHVVSVVQSTVIPYTPTNMKWAIVKWIIWTDQVCGVFFDTLLHLPAHQPMHAMEEESFIEMIQLASQGPKEGVAIPTRKATCIEIINLFCEYMIDLRERFTVSTMKHIQRTTFLMHLRKAKVVFY
jgi:hypothetical protein